MPEQRQFHPNTPVSFTPQEVSQGWRELHVCDDLDHIWMREIYNLFDDEASTIHAWDLSIDRVGMNDNSGQFRVVGHWNFAGRWSDYSLDFSNIDLLDGDEDFEDDSDEEDVKERVIQHMNDFIKREFLKVGYTVKDVYIDDGGFQITFEVTKGEGPPKV
jgi:hypothetical protein